MHKISLACAALGLVLPTLAQTECDNNVPLPSQIATIDPFSANFYVGAPTPPSATFTGFCLYVDLDVSGQLDLTGFQTWLYDQGVGNPPNPDQTGLTGNVNIYTCANSYLGNEQLPPTNPGQPWTLQGTGSVVVVAFPGESIITLAAPITLAAGQYGLCLEFNPPDPNDPANLGQPNVVNAGPLHPLIRSPASQPTQSDPFLSLTSQGFQNDAFVSGSVNADNINLRFDYQPAGGVGYFAQYGAGCYFRPHGFYEQQNPPAVMDLTNTGFTFLPGAGDQYLVFPNPTPTIVPTTGLTSRTVTLPVPNVSTTNSWDDALDDPITIPFAWDAPGGVSTTQITIGSNGHVFLDAVTDPNAAFGYYSAFIDFQDFPARFAPAWGDLDPSVSGGIFYETDGSTFFRITWEGIEEWNVPGLPNTMQLTVTDFGPGAIDQVEIAYGQMNMTAAEMITGWTPGNGADLPPPIDFSAIPVSGYEGGDGSIPPILGMDARPVLGTAPHLVTSNITPGTLFVFNFLDFGAAPLPGGVPLDAVGLPGCFQHISGVGSDGVLVGVNANLEAPRPFAIPNLAGLAGVKLFSQSAPFTAGLNAAGILTSNGMCLRVGL